MDIITDLSARTISFFTTYQEVCKILILDENINSRIIEDNIKTCSFRLDTDVKREILRPCIEKLFYYRVWKPENISLFFNKILALKELYGNSFSQKPVSLDELRTELRNSLYLNAHNRIQLAAILEYMPMQVILALGKKGIEFSDQLIYQVWNVAEEDIRSLSCWRKWWIDNEKRKTYAIRLLKNEILVSQLLLRKGLCLPFESLYTLELEEINKLRMMRSTENPKVKNFSHDPLVYADNLNLKALAFSGGGIRSATFNLGVLQKMAERNELETFDYISTVSGGGYIGSWFVSWLYRLGSVSGVEALLDSRKSRNPMADEVRPIRWLRMYSNYLAPTTGIMSTDSLTMGLTWLRNTIINQLLLILLLCSVLAILALSFEVWSLHLIDAENYNWRYLSVFSLSYLLLGAFITACGLKLFDPEDPFKRFRFAIVTKNLPTWLTAWAGISGLLISAWMKGNLDRIRNDAAYRLEIYLSVFFTVLVAMCFLAYFGRYAMGHKAKKAWGFWLALVTCSAVSAALGTFLLRFCWRVLDGFQNDWDNITNSNEKLSFILGPPMVLESFVLMVVFRMMLMGLLFPDAKREWWGRMGAVVHRVILGWLLLTFGALILPDLLSKFYDNYGSTIPALLGGWSAVIGWAVSLAFKSDAKAGSSKKDGLSIKEVFVRFAPYLFMIGFLLLGAATLKSIRGFFDVPDHGNISYWKEYLYLAIGLSLTSALLSWRIGVNEFSLHHFYRNRLTRAYLGATRKREDREATANGFTGFDPLDDLKMAEFRSSNGYSGPYPLINTAMNASTVSELDRQDRKAESFIFSPLFCGYDFSTYRAAASSKNGIFQYAYRPTDLYAETGGPTIGSAMAISGAAVNPNMGYHSSAPTAFLLTLFNVRLGKWIGNPRLSSWRNTEPGSGLGYLVYDLVGKSDINKEYVCLSDGGHFDNMGLYELVRRRCRDIVLCDAEEDALGSCEGLANAIRRCWIDFGVEIKMDPTEFKALTDKNPQTGFVSRHTAKGDIVYPGDNIPGKLLYIKTTLTDNYSVDIRHYKTANEVFPQQSTGDQFFNEAQFESYRKLGYESA